MRKRTVAMMCGAVVLVAVAVSAAVVSAYSRPQLAESKPPEIGGQQAPSAVREIDFSRRYDVHCEFSGPTLTVFRGCKVVGFTGPDAPESERSESHLLSSGPNRRYFDRWLVLELSDGRLAYIPPSALKYLETAKTP